MLPELWHHGKPQCQPESVAKPTTFYQDPSLMLLEPRSPACVFLHGQAWFASLGPAERNDLLDAMVLRKGGKGEVLLAEGEPIEAWYGVLSGMAKLQTRAPDGRLSAFLGVPAGEWFGEGSVLKGGVWRYD
ncbi:cyclic nucleotide-binding domain-containing protein, partial [Arthrospira platensis SPKY1]|nr:cyclic nucleotide-binding domain-containing protein [Arthrospira platensis SPKY1]